MAKGKWKFNIQNRFSTLPREISAEQLVAWLEKFGISERTYYTDRSIKPDDDTDIPVKRLLIYAKVFDCSLEDMINYKVDAKPIVPKERRVKVHLN